MIEGRLNAVEELTLKTDQLFAIRESLKTFPDLDQVCSAINHIPSKATIKHAEQSINHVLAMKQALLKILALRPLIQDFDSTLFQTIQHVLNDEASTGFSISIPVDVLGDQTLPVEFINVVKKRKNFSFTTLKLVRVCR